jgi:phage terminase large subunit-like protein
MISVHTPGGGAREFENALGVPMPTSSSSDEFIHTLRENGRKSLYYFTTAILNWNKVRLVPHKEMSDFAQEVPPEFPNRKRRKVVLIPRDCYKSTLFSKSLPLWILIQKEFCGLPGLEHRILLSSFSSQNAQKQVQSLMQQVERNETLRMLYPEIIPDIAKTKWTTSNLRFPREGMYGEDTIEAAGVDTHIVSRHYTVQIKDDLEDKQSMEQPSVRERVKTFYRSAEALFVDEQTAYDLLVGTRWGVDDVYSEIFEREAEYYERLVRPLHWDRGTLETDLAEAKETGKPSTYEMDPDTYAPESGKTYFFFPELFPADSCKRIQAKQGSFMYSMLYLNNPKDPSLAEFSADQIVRFRFTQDGDIIYTSPTTGEKEIILFDSLKRVLFWDPAMSEKDPKRNSRNALVAAAKAPQGQILLLDAHAEHKNAGFLVSKFIGMHQRWQIHKAAIEDVNFSRLLKFPLYQRMRELEYSFPVEERHPIGDKDHRIRQLIPYNESNLLFVRDGLTEAMEELKGFPMMTLKDILDAWAACLELLGTVKTQGKNATRNNSNLRAVEAAREASRDAVTGY